MRQYLGISIDDVKAQVVLPDRQRFRIGQRGRAADGVRLPDDELLLPRKPGRGEKRRPVEAGGLRDEIVAGPAMVGVLIGRGCLGGCVTARDLDLERQHRERTLRRTIEAGEFQQARDITLVTAAPLAQRDCVVQVRLPFGQPEPALD